MKPALLWKKKFGSSSQEIWPPREKNCAPNWNPTILWIPRPFCSAKKGRAQAQGLVKRRNWTTWNLVPSEFPLCTKLLDQRRKYYRVKGNVARRSKPGLAPVSSESWVRIPPLPSSFELFCNHRQHRVCKYFGRTFQTLHQHFLLHRCWKCSFH